ncbi:metallophosphoesterase [Variovorax saccharolyticus]|uniref:metallophosphoesterase n=1 Tax=Variovorax saccharolyticus TaxID=3053516 RepID=UPI0025752875|nr:metallophosphoesterase [Variovorax sp. J22R187]MDM0018032.1 metallophosphoesterase family protein [Variovorax sp. J22R187]
MRIQLASDLHLELLSRDFPGETLIRPVPEADILVLAGDIGAGPSAIDMFKDWPVPVLYLCGNHELYGGGAWERVRKAVQRAAAGTSVQVLERDVTEFHGVRILGCTLWTDYRLDGKNAQSEAMAYAHRALNDHRLISTSDGRAFTPLDALRDHELSRAWLEKELDHPYSGRTVVITHHAPHPNSIHPQYSGSKLNAGFASNLTPLVEQADLWLHGHVHNSFDYRVGRCRVVANPRGYALNARYVSSVDQLKFENEDFDYGCLIDTASEKFVDDADAKNGPTPKSQS